MSHPSLHYLILIWDGAGNQFPAIAIAQKLIKQGHKVTFAGYESQKSRFNNRELRFLMLEETHITVLANNSTGMDRMIEMAWCCKEQLKDIPMLVEQEKPDRIIVDCLMVRCFDCCGEKCRVDKNLLHLGAQHF